MLLKTILKFQWFKWVIFKLILARWLWFGKFRLTLAGLDWTPGSGQGQVCFMSFHSETLLMVIHKKPEGVISLKVLPWKRPTVTSAHIALTNASHRAKPNINGLENSFPLPWGVLKQITLMLNSNMWREWEFGAVIQSAPPTMCSPYL